MQEAFAHAQVPDVREAASLEDAGESALQQVRYVERRDDNDDEGQDGGDADRRAGEIEQLDPEDRAEFADDVVPRHETLRWGMRNESIGGVGGGREPLMRSSSNRRRGSGSRCGRDGGFFGPAASEQPESQEHRGGDSAGDEGLEHHGAGGRVAYILPQLGNACRVEADSTLTGHATQVGPSGTQYLQASVLRFDPPVADLSRELTADGTGDHRDDGDQQPEILHDSKLGSQ